MHLFLLLVALAMALAPPAPVTDETASSPGPLRIRDMTPPAILALGFMPGSAYLLGEGRWGFEAHYSQSNVFLMSREVEAYLERRGRRERLSAEDVEAIVASAPGDLFYFDGEIGVLNLALHYGISDRLQAFVQWPFYTFTGGHFDRGIMRFHENFGFSQAGRDLVGRNDFQVLMRLGEDVFALLDAPSDGGFGDPTLGVRHSFGALPHGWQAGLEVAVKIPVASTRAFLSSGDVDLGAQLLLEKRWGRGAAYLSASYVWLGDFGFADFDAANVPSVTAAYSYDLTPRTAVVLQGLAARSIFAKETASELSSREYQASAGLRVRRGKLLWSLALTENISNFNNTPDIGAHLSVCYSGRPY